LFFIVGLHVLSKIMLDWPAAQGFPGWPPETGNLGVIHEVSFILLESSSLDFLAAHSPVTFTRQQP